MLLWWLLFVLLCLHKLLCMLLCVPQGMGNLVNGCVILMCMAMFNMTGALPVGPIMLLLASWTGPSCQIGLSCFLAGIGVLVVAPECSQEGSHAIEHPGISCSSHMAPFGML